MDIYDQNHMDAMFWFCDDNQDEYIRFCERNNYSSENMFVLFCRQNESQYIDFLQHYNLF